MAKMLRNPMFWFSVINVILGAFNIYNFWFYTRPYQEKSLTRSADIVLDVIPSLGYINDSYYFTQTKPVKNIDFYVILWNKGNATAENVSVILRGEPQIYSWYDYHWSIVSLSGFSYRPSSSNASIRALLPNQQAQIQYRMSINSTGYDQLRKEGKEPKIIIELIFASIRRRYVYTVEMP